MQSEIAVASITFRPCSRTLRYEISWYFVAVLSIIGSAV